MSILVLMAYESAGAAWMYAHYRDASGPCCAASAQMVSRASKRHRSSRSSTAASLLTLCPHAYHARKLWAAMTHVLCISEVTLENFLRPSLPLSQFIFLPVSPSLVPFVTRLLSPCAGACALVLPRFSRGPSRSIHKKHAEAYKDVGKSGIWTHTHTHDL